jgi:hypothetical protein
MKQRGVGKPDRRCRGWPCPDPRHRAGALSGPPLPAGPGLRHRWDVAPTTSVPGLVTRVTAGWSMTNFLVSWAPGCGRGSRWASCCTWSGRELRTAARVLRGRVVCRRSARSSTVPASTGAGCAARPARLAAAALDPDPLTAVRRRVVTPARYIFVQAVDPSGRNLTASAGKDVFRAQVVLEHDGKRSTLKSQLSDRGDGTYQIFFYYGIQPDRLLIHVTGRDGVYVGGKGPRAIRRAEVEQCYCPASDVEDWAEHYGCRADEPQISHDFENFPRISKDAVASTLTRLQTSERNCFVHYMTRDNRLYGKAYGMWQGFKQYTDEMILSLMRRVTVPDTEFIFNLGDWPLGNGTQQVLCPVFATWLCVYNATDPNSRVDAVAHVHVPTHACNHTQGLPIISFCGSNSSTDIVVPTYKLFLATVFGTDSERASERRWRDREQGKRGTGGRKHESE